MFANVRLFSLVSLLTLSMSFSAFAKDEVTERAALAQAWLSGSLTGCNADLGSFAGHQEKMLSHYKDNLSVRGFDNLLFPKSNENRKIAKQKGFLWWYTQSFLVANEEEARKHAKQFSNKENIQDQFSVGLYFFGSESELGVKHSKKGTQVPIQNLAKIFAGGALEIDYLSDEGEYLETPRERRISGEDLLRRIDPQLMADPSMATTFVTGTPRSYFSNYLNINGWHTGKFRGVINHREFVESSSFKKIVHEYQDLWAIGYRLIFRPTSESIKDDTIDVLKKTPRKKRMVINGKNVDVDLGTDINRHVLETDLSYLLTDKSYMAVLLNPAGQVVGGEVGDVENMTGESVLYDPERALKHMEDLLGASAISAAYVYLNSLEQGLEHSSSGPMVSNFSRSIGAKVVPIEKALAIFARSNQDLSKMTSNYIWNPFDTAIGRPRVEQKFEALRRSIIAGAITNNMFVGTSPDINSATASMAREFGLEPGQIYVEFVDSFQSARSLSHQSPRGLQTVYVVAPGFKPNIGVNALDEFKRLFNDKLKIPAIPDQKKPGFTTDSPVHMIVSFKEPHGNAPHYYDGRLVLQLGLDSHPEFSWAEGSSGVMAIKGWVSSEKDPEAVRKAENARIEQKRREQEQKNAEWKARRSDGRAEITDRTEIEKMVNEVIAKNPGQVDGYRAGNSKLFGFFVGQVMKASKGQANSEILTSVLKEKL